MEKTAEEMLKKHGYESDPIPVPIVLMFMKEHAALKSSQDNKALTASFEAGINSLAYDAKKLQEELTAEKLKVINLRSDNKALMEQVERLILENKMLEWNCSRAQDLIEKTIIPPRSRNEPNI